MAYKEHVDWRFKRSPFNMNTYDVSWGSVMDYSCFFARGKDASPTQAAEARSAGEAAGGPLVCGDSNHSCAACAGGAAGSDGSWNPGMDARRADLGKAFPEI